jgi:heptosyltransferase-2
MKILVIQTAFIGDVILATAVLEKLYTYFPNSFIDVLVRKGNESLFANHPFLRQTLVWQKQSNKYKYWWKLLQTVRQEKYNVLINLQRFTSMGLFTALSNAEQTIGFENTPFSFLFSKKYPHQIGNGIHETQRNQVLIADLTDNQPAVPRLYPTAFDDASVKHLKSSLYVCIAPASVWQTKQFPKHKWVDLILNFPKYLKVYLLGSKGDIHLCAEIIGLLGEVQNIQIENLAGKLGLLASAALMRDAVMNYVNDSAPMHLASAINAPTCAIFCSTSPNFGFTPLAKKSFVVQIDKDLACRPCGLHGKKSCPKGHFKCGEEIKTAQLLEGLLF